MTKTYFRDFVFICEKAFLINRCPAHFLLLSTHTKLQLGTNLAVATPLRQPPHSLRIDMIVYNTLIGKKLRTYKVL